MATSIADTACVDPGAVLGDGVEVGHYCVLGPEVRIGQGTRLLGHVCILGITTIGRDNIIFPFTTLGDEPPQIPVRGASAYLEIGDANVIREHVTIPGNWVDPGDPTRLGDRNLLMAGVQLGAGCELGDHTTLGDRVVLAEGVRVDSYATLSAVATVHRRVTIGGSSFVGVQARVHHDVPPFMLVDGSPARVRGLNLLGLKRRGVAKPGIDAMREAHRLLFRGKMPLDQATEMLETHGHLTDEVAMLLVSLRAQQTGRHGRARDLSVEADTVET